MNYKWTPPFRLDLLDVIDRNNNINGLHIGSPEFLITKLLGEPELPVAKLSKKSKILNHLYGNVSILSEHEHVIAINIDFLSNRSELITKDKIKSWTINNWLELSVSKHWELNKINDTLQLVGDGISISLFVDGKLGMVSIR